MCGGDRCGISGMTGGLTKIRGGGKRYVGVLKMWGCVIDDLCRLRVSLFQQRPAA